MNARRPAENYPTARARLLGGLAELGYAVRTDFKIAQAKLPSGEVLRFRPQAVYLEAHSLWIDIRGMSLEQFLEAVAHAQKTRQKAQEAGESGLSSAHLLVRTTSLPPLPDTARRR